MKDQVEYTLTVFPATLKSSVCALVMPLQRGRRREAMRNHPDACVLYELFGIDAAAGRQCRQRRFFDGPEDVTLPEPPAAIVET